VNAPRRPTLRQEQQAATRQRLLDAARDSFAEHGFVSTTVDRIVEAANTSRATFYLHFKNKTDALVHTWIERELPEVESMFREFDAKGNFSVSATRSFMKRVVTYWEEHAGTGVNAVQALALEPELNVDWIRNMSQVVKDMPNLCAAVDADEPMAQAIVLARVIQFERILYFWVSGGLPYDRKTLIEVLVHQWSAPN
jgi:AcrR family transcriptional regulator